MADDPLAVALEEENPCAGGTLPEDKCINIRRFPTTKNGCLCKSEGKEGRSYVDWKGYIPWGMPKSLTPLVDAAAPYNKKENWCEVENKDAPGCAASRYNDYWYDWVDRSRERPFRMRRNSKKHA